MSQLNGSSKFSSYQHVNTPDFHEYSLDDEEIITQEDCWTVINSFFEDKGLVSQQLDSFDEFINNTMQEIVDENQSLVLQTSTQYSGQENDVTKQYIIKFGQIYLSKPTMTESDGVTNYMYPNEARLRNLTYCAPVYVDMRKMVQKADPKDERNRGITNPTEMHWQVEEEDEEDTKVFIGKVPMMLKSQHCVLKKLEVKDLHDVGECPYDQVLQEQCNILIARVATL